MKVTSSAFNAKRPIPERYWFEGEHIPPPLRWEATPPGTAELALMVEDPDRARHHQRAARVADKARELEELTRSLGVPLSEVCYVGDDQPDVAPMAMAGLAAAPADAASAAKAEAGIQLEHRGGRGAVRELADLLLGAG